MSNISAEIALILRVQAQKTTALRYACGYSGLAVCPSRSLVHGHKD